MDMYSLQLLLCYAMIGFLMGTLLGLLPFWHMWERKHVAVFLLLLIAWLPVAIIVIIIAPLVNLIDVQEEAEVR